MFDIPENKSQNVYKCFNCGVEGRENPTPPYTLAEQFIGCWYNIEDKNVCSILCYEIIKDKYKSDINDDDDDLGMPDWLLKNKKMNLKFKKIIQHINSKIKINQLLLFKYRFLYHLQEKKTII